MLNCTCLAALRHFQRPEVEVVGNEAIVEERWVYLEFPTSLVVKVQCMLATSLKELVRILGAGNAHNDLVQVFKSSITTDRRSFPHPRALHTAVLCLSDPSSLLRPVQSTATCTSS
jgi:hypothetical protein